MELHIGKEFAALLENGKLVTFRFLGRIDGEILVESPLNSGQHIQFATLFTSKALVYWRTDGESFNQSGQSISQ
jgi:hypothetical protein